MSSPSEDDNDSDYVCSEESSESSDTLTEESENEDGILNEDSGKAKEKITLKAKKDKRSGGKWKVCQEQRPFKSSWMGLFPWVEEDCDDMHSAICRVCNTKMKAQKGILDSHQKTKKHLRNSGLLDDSDEIRKEEKIDPRTSGFTTIEQLTDDQISFFTESPADLAHQAVTNLIDKLVEKYHERKIENRKRENKVRLEVNALRTKMLRTENYQKMEQRQRQDTYKRELEEQHLKFLQIEHETKIRAMENERDAKLKAVEQELLFAKQEYEKKVRLLDSQLSSMK